MASIGVDIGALYLKAVRLDEAGRIVASVYERHRGEPADVLSEAMDRLNVQPDDPVGLTGCNAELFAAQLEVPYRDVTLCQIDAVRRMAPDAFALMDIGGGSATLIQLDGKGKFQGYSTNSLCAAGTGSFLDEQAGRLGISVRGRQGLPAQPQSADDRHPLHGVRQERPDPPPAGRLQPDGHVVGPVPRHDADAARHAAQRAAARGQTALIGGVALNAEVVRWLEHDCPGLIDVPEQPHLVAAYGAALSAKPAATRPRCSRPGARRASRTGRPVSVAAHAREVDVPVVRHARSYEDGDGNEVRVTRWPEGEASAPTSASTSAPPAPRRS